MMRRAVLSFVLINLIGWLVAVGMVARIFRPAVSADVSGQIAFLAKPECPGCRAMISVVYGERYRPVTLPVEPFAFAWSPDGMRLAFIGHAEDETSALVVAAADGAQPIPLASVNFLDSLSWSPDSQWIAYSRSLNNDNAIFILRADGTEQRRLTLGLYTMSPVWSPDSERILMQVRGYQGQQIYFVELDGGIANLTGDSAYDYAPVWSPDGERIAFLSRDRTQTVSAQGVPLTQVFIMDRDGRNLHQISAVDGNVFGVRWSPQGDMLALYVAEARADLPAWGNLYVVDLAQMRLVQLTDSAQTNNIGDFMWSPDGTRLVYVVSPLRYSQICIQTLGDEARCLAGDAARKSELHWLTGAPLPELPIPDPTPVIDGATPTPSERLDKTRTGLGLQ